MYISEYSDADICRYLDDQNRFLCNSGQILIHLSFKPFYLVIDVGAQYPNPIEISTHGAPISLLKAVFVQWDDDHGFCEPYSHPATRGFPWAKRYGPGCIGRQHKIPELCQVIRDLNRITRLKAFI